MLKEYIARKGWIEAPSVRRSASCATCWCTAPKRCRCGTPSASRAITSGTEAGATAVQELAFTLAGRNRLRARWESMRDWDVDSFASRLSYFFDVHNDFFEIAKVPRRMHLGQGRARALPCQNPALVILRTHAQTVGVSCGAAAAQQRGPHDDSGAGSGVSGTQSLHTNSYDETYALPTEDAVTLALHSSNHRRGIGHSSGRRSARWQLLYRKSSPMTWKSARWRTSTRSMIWVESFARWKTVIRSARS